LGLTSVLLHLGTRSVIAGVARVDDDVAAEVMVRYTASSPRGATRPKPWLSPCPISWTHRRRSSASARIGDIPTRIKRRPSISRTGLAP